MGSIWGNQTWCKCMVILRDSSLNSAVFGVGSFKSPLMVVSKDLAIFWPQTFVGDTWLYFSFMASENKKTPTSPRLVVKFFGLLTSRSLQASARSLTRIELVDSGSVTYLPTVKGKGGICLDHCSTVKGVNCVLKSSILLACISWKTNNDKRWKMVLLTDIYTYIYIYIYIYTYIYIYIYIYTGNDPQTRLI